MVEGAMGSGPTSRTLLYVVNSYDFFLSHRLSLARAAQEQGFSVAVASPWHPDAGSDPTITHVTIPCSRRGINPFAEARTLFAIHAAFRRIQPDVVHLLTMKPIMYGGIAARFHRSKVAVVQAVTGLGYLFSENTLRAKTLRIIAKAGLRFALNQPNGHVIFQNQDDQATLIDARLTDLGTSSLIRGSGVNPEEYRFSPEPRGPPIVLMASRLLWSKGLEEFIEAARILNDRGDPTRFQLAGKLDPGNPSSASEDQLIRWTKEGIIEYIGWIEDMNRAYQDVHIVCLPSKYGEGVPKALIEAAACGRPIVTTDTPGCRDIVLDGYNGRLVPIRDAAALADAIQDLSSNPRLRQKYGLAGRQRVIDSFASDIVHAETMEIYEKLLGASHEPNQSS